MSLFTWIKRHSKNLIIPILSGLFVVGTVRAAETYYDLDIGEYVVNEAQRFIGDLSLTGDFTANNSFHINATTGNVGINTTTPTERLHVDGSGIFTGTVSGAIATLPEHFVTLGQVTGAIGDANHDPVTLSGENYLSLSGQQLTANPINLSGTHVTGTLPVSRGGTGATSFTANNFVRVSSNGSSLISRTPAQVLTDIGGVPTSRSISTGTGLTGGGDLSANRSISVNFGTTAGTVAQGNDSRIVNGQTAFGWGNHATAGYLSQTAINTSAKIAAIVGDETGTGSLVFNTNPIFSGDLLVGSSMSGTGSKMFFNSSLSAFRAGYIDGDRWDSSNIGNYSSAFGYNTLASGNYSTAFGSYSRATGTNSVAFGSTGIVALGPHASGNKSIAFGFDPEASGDESIAFGSGAKATGMRSIAFGNWATTASGIGSIAFGEAATAQAAYSIVIGRYNRLAGDASSWVATDPLFVIGNGSSAAARSNAMTVLKNGNTGIGIATPTQLLHVAGSARIQGSIYDSTNSPGTTGQVLLSTGSGTEWVPASGLGLGTVTSVATGTGLTGGPITTAGTISVNFGTTAGTVAEGNDSRIVNGQTAFLWGNHASAGYLTSFTETDPTVPAHVKSITSSNITNWNAAYGWGNHATANYLTASAIDTSAKIAAIVGDETGTGSLVFNTNPTFSGNVASTTFRGASGTATAPTFSFTGDTNTGMYSGGNDILRFSTAGSDKMTILANGNVGIGTAAPLQRLHVEGGSLLVTGTHGGGNGVNTTGAGTRAFFDTNKSAFRAGEVTGAQWNDTNVGAHSAAFGINTQASGLSTMAFGDNTTASGDYSTAFGGWSVASGANSTAFGFGTTASGNTATAFGWETTASGNVSTAFGSETTASGYRSAAFGFNTEARAYQLVAGRYNTVAGHATNWTDTDPLFILGNGESDVARSNAMTVLKNGNVGLGTATPTSTLDVVGNATFLGNFAINGNQFFVTTPSERTDHFAWSETAGWINFASGDVELTSTALTGTAWGENVGRIFLSCVDAGTCDAVNYGVQNDGGTLSGYAWSDVVGWIDFAPPQGGVTVDSNGDFSGFAWGENIGWISFNCLDTGSCGTSNYKVSVEGMGSSDGNIGIGTDTPTSKLTVVGSGSFTGTVSGAEAARYNEFVTLGQMNRVLPDRVFEITNAGGEWVEHTAPNGPWESVAYGGGRFVAIHWAGIMTSLDGINWTTASVPDGEAWFSITHGNGMFVAVSQEGDVMTSPDGLSWTMRSTPVTSAWNSVAYGNGVFVAVGETGSSRIMTSVDGVTWTASTTPASSAWYDVAYGNGRFVVIAAGSNEVMTSFDGVTWTANAGIPSSTWLSIAYGNGVFVAVSYAGDVATSPDGSSWTVQTPPTSQNWTSVSYGNDRFVAVAENSDRIITSEDGVDWRTVILPATSHWVSVAHGDNLVVIISRNDTRVMVSVPNTASYSGNIMIGGSLDVAGNAIANSFINRSTSASKVDVERFNTSTLTQVGGKKMQSEDILEKISRIDIATYRYLNDDPNEPKRIGLMADDPLFYTPDEVLAFDDEENAIGVDLYKLSTFLLAGIQELNLKVDKIAIGEGDVGGSLGSIIQNGLRSLGVEIRNSVARFAGIITDALTVGSTDNPAGITLYNENGEPYCMKVDTEGDLYSEPGKCEDLEGQFGDINDAPPTTPPTKPAPETPEDPNPDPNPDPEPEPEPEPEPTEPEDPEEPEIPEDPTKPADPEGDKNDEQNEGGGNGGDNGNSKGDNDNGNIGDSADKVNPEGDKDTEGDKNDGSTNAGGEAIE